MIREITNKNLHLLLPSKVSLFAKIYAEENGGTLLDALRIFYQSNTYKKLFSHSTNHRSMFRVLALKLTPILNRRRSSVSNGRA